MQRQGEGRERSTWSQRSGFKNTSRMFFDRRDRMAAVYRAVRKWIQIPLRQAMPAPMLFKDEVELTGEWRLTVRRLELAVQWEASLINMRTNESFRARAETPVMAIASLSAVHHIDPRIVAQLAHIDQDEPIDDFDE